VYYPNAGLTVYVYVMSKCTQVNCAEIALLELLEAGVLIAQLDDEWSGLSC